MVAKAYVPSIFGWFELTGTELGLQSVRLQEYMSIPPTYEVPDELGDTVQQLAEYFDGRRKSFDLILDWGDAPDFHRAVWQELLHIPYGHTTSYKSIAEKLGDPKAVRAVGQANRHNPIAIIVPCHRVIARNGELQGYFYGLNMKRALLAHENPNSFAEQGSLF